jgi:hypothetical protein
MRNALGRMARGVARAFGRRAAGGRRAECPAPDPTHFKVMITRSFRMFRVVIV